VLGLFSSSPNPSACRLNEALRAEKEESHVAELQALKGHRGARGQAKVPLARASRIYRDSGFSFLVAHALQQDVRPRSTQQEVRGALRARSGERHALCDTDVARIVIQGGVKGVLRHHLRATTGPLLRGLLVAAGTA